MQANTKLSRYPKELFPELVLIELLFAVLQSDIKASKARCTYQASTQPSRTVQTDPELLNLLFLKKLCVL